MLSWLIALLIVVFIRPVAPGAEPPRAALVAFWVAGGFVGIGMGATSSSCRALVGLFSPIDRSGEFFGLWGLAVKLGSIVGPFLFGLVSRFVGDIRIAELVTGTFFIASYLLMALVNEQEGRAAVRAEQAQHPA